MPNSNPTHSNSHSHSHSHSHSEPTKPTEPTEPTEPTPLRPPRLGSSAALSELGRSVLAGERRSFIAEPTTLTRKKAIISIAIRKGLLVFFSVHSVISTSFAALALVRRKPHRAPSASKSVLTLLVESFRSPSTARLASWLGLYSALWTLTYSFLQKSNHALSQWNAFFAGSLCGVSFFAQSKNDRKELAPNVICRAIYTMFMCYPWFPFKYGDMLLFALSNAQMAIGYLLYPSTLPRWYVHWITRVGGLNGRYVELNRQMNRGIVGRTGAAIVAGHGRLLMRDTLPRTATNERRIQSFLAAPARRRSAPCALHHHRHDSCLRSNVLLFLRTWLKMAPTYAILHLVPALIFRSKVLLKAPIKFLSAIVKKTIASGLFISTFASVVQNCFCIPTKLYDHYGVVLPASSLYGLLGFTTGVALLWEEPKRRGELALYCAPKALYSLWAVLKAKRLVPAVVYGDILVCALGCGLLMDCFVHRKARMPPLTRGIIGQLVDPHTPTFRRDPPSPAKSSDPPPSPPADRLCSSP